MISIEAVDNGILTSFILRGGRCRDALELSILIENCLKSQKSVCGAKALVRSDHVIYQVSQGVPEVELQGVFGLFAPCLF